MAETNEGRRIIAEKSKSFSLASKLLPADIRDDAVAVYAWCRRCDDAIDDAPQESLDAALNALRSEADELFRGTTLPDSVGSAFQDVVRRRRIPREYVDELMAGMAMDARGVWAPSIEELRLYCYRVAGVVGLMMCHVLGARQSRALVFATHLGMGMQLTNISRDVAEDWQRGRLYLPRQWVDSKTLENDGASSLDSDTSKRLRPAIARLLRWADKHYESGRLGLNYLDGRSAWGVATAAAVYQEIGREVRKQNCDPLAGRAFVGRSRKMTLAAGLYFKSLIPRVFERISVGSARLPPPTDILPFGEVPAIEPPD
jgi:phytoene synthase